MFYKSKKMFAGHTKMLCGPYVARGPDVAQACPRNYKPSKKIELKTGTRSCSFNENLKLEVLIRLEFFVPPTKMFKLIPCGSQQILENVLVIDEAKGASL